jgi:hypothetical protein
MLRLIKGSPTIDQQFNRQGIVTLPFIFLLKYMYLQHIVTFELLKKL